MAKQTQKSVPASFKGHAQIVNGSELVTTGLKGSIGKDHFTGSGTGSVNGTQFEGGSVYLSNGKGTIQLSLGAAFTVKVRKSTKCSFWLLLSLPWKIRAVRRRIWVVDVSEYARRARRRASPEPSRSDGSPPVKGSATNGIDATQARKRVRSSFDWSQARLPTGTYDNHDALMVGSRSRRNDLVRRALGRIRHDRPASHCGSDATSVGPFLQVDLGALGRGGTQDSAVEAAFGLPFRLRPSVGHVVAQPVGRPDDRRCRSFQGLGPRFVSAPEPLSFVRLLYMSGSIFLTLGLSDVTSPDSIAWLFILLEAASGYIFLALVITYMPVLEQAYSAREVGNLLIHSRAGRPPSATNLLRRYASTERTDVLRSILRESERWMAETLQSHLSHPVLSFYRSGTHWGSVLANLVDYGTRYLCALDRGRRRIARVAGEDHLPHGNLFAQRFIARAQSRGRPTVSCAAGYSRLASVTRGRRGVKPNFEIGAEQR